jgi:hypothetical protein
MVGLGEGEGGREAVDAECIRIARRLREAGRRVVGFLPATATDAVAPVALRIGRALTQLTGATVAYVDANAHWPALAAVSTRPSSSSGDEESLYVTRWMTGTLALLAPRGVAIAGAAVPQLRRVLDDGAALFEHMLVDLTGFDRLGEHAAASALMDGLIVVARPGGVSEGALLAFTRSFPRRELLGVLLVG